MRRESSSQTSRPEKEEVGERGWPLMQPHRSLSKIRQRRNRTARQSSLESARGEEHRTDQQNYGIRRCLLSFLCCHRQRELGVFRFFHSISAFLYLVFFEEVSQLRPPPPGSGRRKTLVLDLDETLVHTSTSFDACGAGGQARNNTTAPELRLDISPSATHQRRAFYVRLRPYVHDFLRECTEMFDVVVFTASEQSYAEPIIKYLCNESGTPYPSRCFFRQSCETAMGLHVKDLSKVRQDLSKVVLIDNSPGAAAYQPDNYIPCTSWFGSSEDTELLDLLVLLRELAQVSDVRSLLGLRLSRSQLL